MGAEGPGKCELSVQSLGWARGGRCSVPRPKVRRRGTPSACAKVCGPWPRGKVLPPGPFFSLNEFQTTVTRHTPLRSLSHNCGFPTTQYP
jgi:hypothetical protein